MSISAQLGIGFMRALSHVPLPVVRGFGSALRHRAGLSRGA